MAFNNVSSAVTWELVRKNNAFLVKRRSNGGVYFSRDPLNPTNIHSRQYSGFADDKAINVVQEGDKLAIISKKAGHANKPATQIQKSVHGANRSPQRVYKAAAYRAARHGYRSDLREALVQRASAYRYAAEQNPPSSE